MSDLGLPELTRRGKIPARRSASRAGKQTRVSFQTAGEQARGILEIVHSDVWGPVLPPFSQEEVPDTILFDLHRRLLQENMGVPAEVEEPSLQQVQDQEG